ncbi:MAG: cytochrome c [Rhodocyclaceae bacterium]|nr:cytochrome c [Rhodocyclaceae bacterium]
MKRTLAIAAGTLLLATASFAGPREDLLAQYGAAAKSAGFSAAQGQALHTRNFAGGKPDTPACTSCHGKDPRAGGRTLAGKDIAPMAVSATPTRYTDPAKVEKWFKRNCNEVLGRECTPQEKGDWLTYMIGQ